MDIQAEKIALAKMLLETNNAEIIAAVKSIFNREKSTDFWDELTLDQKTEIEKATAEIENGEVIDYEMFMKSHR